MDAADFIQLALQGDEQQALRELSADPSLARARNAQGVSVVCLAVYRGRVELAIALRAARTDLDVFEATCVGDVLRVRDLVSADASAVNSVSPDGFSPVGYAAFFGHPVLLRELIARGGEVNAPSQNGMRVCPLHSASANTDQARAVELARIVLDAGAEPNAKQQGGFTPLHAAAHHGNAALVELLLARGADRTIKNDKDETAADIARAKGHDAALQRLERSA